jgi:hypothetical protein
MKNGIGIIILSGIMVLLSACTISIPNDFEDYGGFRVVLQVYPEDADVLLNGKFIGAAYEFATARNALTLSTRNHELTLRRDGYVEEMIDLSDYTSHYINLKITLNPERKSDARTPEPRNRDGYQPKTEKPRELPPETPAEQPAGPPPTALTRIILSGAPADATIYVDGRYWGLFPESGRIDNLRLKPGRYVIEVFSPGYKPLKKELQVAREKIDLPLILEKQ